MTSQISSCSYIKRLFHIHKQRCDNHKLTLMVILRSLLFVNTLLVPEIFLEGLTVVS